MHITSIFRGYLDVTCNKWPDKNVVVSRITCTQQYSLYFNSVNTFIAYTCQSFSIVAALSLLLVTLNTSQLKHTRKQGDYSI